MPAPTRISKQKYGSNTPNTLALPASSTAATGGFPVRGKGLNCSLVWTGTPTGSFSLQCSYDGGTNWRTVPGASAEFTANGNAQPAGSASSMVVNFRHIPGGIVRFLYTATSGTGTLTYFPIWTD